MLAACPKLNVVALVVQMAPVTTPAAAAAPVSNPAAVLNVAPTDPAAVAVAMEGVAKSPSPAKSLQARQPQPVSSGSQPNQQYHPNRLICNATSPITNNRFVHVKNCLVFGFGFGAIF